MSTISSDKKMQLAKLIRDEHQNNRTKMQSREEFLYGKRSYSDKTLPLDHAEIGSDSTPTYSSFSFRFFIAVLLLIGFIFWDNSSTKVMGTSSDEIYTLLQDESVLINIIDFMDNITYTQESVEKNALESNTLEEGTTQKD